MKIMSNGAGDQGYDAPCAPHIHLRSVDRSTQQQLWWSVPLGDHAVGVITPASLLVDSCKTEISQFELATAVNENIRPFDIAMNNALVMKVRQPREHLLTERLQMCIGEHEVGLPQDTTQIMVHVLDDHINRP